MVLKTRTAMCKYRLFRKFKINFFNVFSKSSRVSRRLLRVKFKCRPRYKFWNIKHIKGRMFKGHIIGNSYRSLLRLWPTVAKRFILSPKIGSKIKIARKRMKRFVKNIALSNGIRSEMIKKSNLINQKRLLTPVNERFTFVYSF